MSDKAKADFLRDEASQVLALADALLSAHGSAIADLFNEIARLRGLAQLAREAGIETEFLHKALADPRKPDLAMLGRVVEVLQRARRP